MPTTRPRYTITETDELAAALNEAALSWPELRGDRAALVRRIIDVGIANYKNRSGVHALVAAAAGAASGTYPRDARAELLAEWPE